MNDIKPIQTYYKGYKFRSRLEARWAVFFDQIGIDWEYETEGFDLGVGVGYYLPDFYLPYTNTYIDIKPTGYPRDEERLKCRTLAIRYPTAIFDGDPYRLILSPGQEFYAWNLDNPNDVSPVVIHHVQGVWLPFIYCDRFIYIGEIALGISRNWNKHIGEDEYLNALFKELGDTQFFMSMAEINRACEYSRSIRFENRS